MQFESPGWKETILNKKHFTVIRLLYQVTFKKGTQAAEK